MGQMKKMRKFGIIDSNDSLEEQQVIRLCEHCLEYGLKNRLGPRLYRHDEEIPSDWEEWLMCPKCGNVVGKWETKLESSVIESARTSDSPFNEGRSMTGLNNITRGRTKTTDLHKRIKRMKKEIAAEKDEDIKAELKKGNQVTIVEDNNMMGDR